MEKPFIVKEPAQECVDKVEKVCVPVTRQHCTTVQDTVPRLVSYGDFLSYFQTGKLWRFSFLFPTTGIENLFRSMVSHERNRFNKINADRPAPVTIYI